MAHATTTLPSLPNVTACQPYQPTSPTYNVEHMVRPGAWFAAAKGNASAEAMAMCCGTNSVQLFAQTCELFCAVPEHKYADITKSDGFDKCLRDQGVLADLKYGQGERESGGKPSSGGAMVGAAGGLGLMWLGLFAVQAFAF